MKKLAPLPAFDSFMFQGRCVRGGVVGLIAVLAGGLLVAARPTRADVVHLTDGSTVEGIVKKSGDGWDVTRVDGKVIHVTAENLRQIELTSKGNTPDAAGSKLASLRRSVENIPDIKIIRDRYEKFIEANKNTAAAADALKDLAIWQDRMDRNMVKVGPNWLTAEEKERVLERNFIAVDGVRQLIKAGRFNEADPVLQQILVDDPTNAGALYLRGLILFKQEQWPLARKTFDAAKEAQPNYGPTLNNIAVILWHQNQYLGALNLYDGAMASPAQFQIPILNNVAEALNAVPPELKNNATVTKVTKHFTDLDTVMQQQMLQAGYFRWGATWVDKNQLEQLKAAEAKIQKTLTDMQAEYDAHAAHINRIDAELADIERAMKRIENTSVTRDTSGNIIRLPLPSAYYDYDHDHHKLQAQRIELVARLDSLRAAARALQQQLPTPKYTGLQQIIGIEGTPMPAVSHAPAAPAQANPVPLPGPGELPLK